MDNQESEERLEELEERLEELEAELQDAKDALYRVEADIAEDDGECAVSADYLLRCRNNIADLKLEIVEIKATILLETPSHLIQVKSNEYQ